MKMDWKSLLVNSHLLTKYQQQTTTPEHCRHVIGVDDEKRTVVLKFWLSTFVKYLKLIHVFESLSLSILFFSTGNKLIIQTVVIDNMSLCISTLNRCKTLFDRLTSHVHARYERNTRPDKKPLFVSIFIFFRRCLIGNGHKINQLDKSNLVDGLVCDIAWYIYLLFLFWLALRDCKYTAQFVKILCNVTHKMSYRICLSTINYGTTAKTSSTKLAVKFNSRRGIFRQPLKNYNVCNY